MTEADKNTPRLTIRQIIEHLILQERVSFASRQTNEQLGQLFTSYRETLIFETIIDRIKTKLLKLSIDQRDLLRQPHRDDIKEEIAVFITDLHHLLLELTEFLTPYNIDTSEFREADVKILDPYFLPPP